jgi:hypothetical protein
MLISAWLLSDPERARLLCDLIVVPSVWAGMGERGCSEHWGVVRI